VRYREGEGPTTLERNVTAWLEGKGGTARIKKRSFRNHRLGKHNPGSTQLGTARNNREISGGSDGGDVSSNRSFCSFLERKKKNKEEGGEKNWVGPEGERVEPLEKEKGDGFRGEPCWAKWNLPTHKMGLEGMVRLFSIRPTSLLSRDTFLGENR